MKKKILSITILTQEGITYEDIPSEELENGFALAKSKLSNWCVFDIKSGLTLFTNKKTRKEALEKFAKMMNDSERVKRIESARNSLTYKDRCLAMELHAQYR